VIGALAAAPVAIADIQTSGGTVAADTAATAYPAQPGVTYTGTLNPDTSTYHDLDYLALTANAGETVQITFQNTTVGSKPSFPLTCDNYCEEFLSLDKPNPNYPPPPDALGLCDGAGTRATYGDTEIFDWTFAQPGTYYLLMESNGDEAPGNPSYAVEFANASATGGGTGGTGGPGAGPGGGPGPPLVRSLHIAPHQRGPAVAGAATLGRAALSLRVTLRSTSGAKIAALVQGRLAAGAHRFRISLPLKWRRLLHRRHRLTLKALVAVRAVDTAESFSQTVRLTG
jgi:hypothetical protein